MFNTPILFLVFNRLDTTKQVFAKIREIQPKQLFIGADGARPDKEGEKEKVEAVRNYILENIDWECEVKTLFREKNLGCGKAVSEAITWFFDNVEQGIILEDDTLPDLSFFTFCEQLLNYYKDEERVMHITGTSLTDDRLVGEADYFISKWPCIWGWATWSTAWKKYDFLLKNINYPELSRIFNFYQLDKKEIKFWSNIFNDMKHYKIDTWDLQWTLSILNSQAYSIIPQKNLISNIGFGENATHTIQTNSQLANRNIEKIKVKKFIPKNIIEITDKKADKLISNYFNPSEPTLSYIKNKILYYTPSPIRKFFKKLLLKL